ncbi:hypothetical protein CONLIGDRAFT_630291 [Coniochaeta ligniaria NRRL 30616]|uniref:Uncharacterized protein n=1 Tax=Coniochaeta ligniaria NRRL 30616 TaxID=1408157 RepID=A0A1J7JRL9_9PEZI|nr:hypothetical protein CONLIGDRAFT_630291 [Coniochaeta ligniaria NRRL 30616]
MLPLVFGWFAILGTLFFTIAPVSPTMSGPSIDNDAFFRDLPPLPAGWDWKRCKAVQQAEWDALPDGDKSLISAYRTARDAEWRSIRSADEAARYRKFHLDLRRIGYLGRIGLTDSMTVAEAEVVAAAAPPPAPEDDYLTPEELAVVDHFGLPREQVGTPLFEIAEVMHRQECDYWGFMLFRVWGYGSATEEFRWEEWLRRSGAMVSERLGRMAIDGIMSTGLDQDDEDFEARFTEMYEPAMRGGILSRWRIEGMMHEDMSGMGPQDVRDLFREVLKMDEEEEKSLPNRVLCLMVDEGVVSSLLDEGRRPYIIGVLSDIDEEGAGDNSEALHFKIALESVVDLWRQIQVQSVYVLLPPKGKIYISPGVFEDDDSVSGSFLAKWWSFFSSNVEVSHDLGLLF